MTFSPRYRLLGIAAIVILGMIVGFASAGATALWREVAWGVAFTCVAVWAWRIRVPGVTRTMSVSVILFVVGWILAARVQTNLDDTLMAYQMGGRQTLTVRLGEEFDRVARADGGGWQVRFAVDETHMGQRVMSPWPPVITIISVETHGQIPVAGEWWQCTGFMSFRARKAGRRFAPILFWVQDAKDAIRLAPVDETTWQARMNRWSDVLVKKTMLGIEDFGEIPALNAAILLGRRAAIPQALKDVFIDAGTVHIFAISGLHVFMVALMLMLLVRFLHVSQRYHFLIVVPLLIFYTAITGARPSAIRACLMASIYLAAPGVGRRSNVLLSLAATALLVYSFNPALLFDLGCTLSFVVMLGIAYWCRGTREIFAKIGDQFVYPRVAWLMTPLTALERHQHQASASGRTWTAGILLGMRKAIPWVAGSFGISFAAWVAGVPLSAYYFGRFVPGGLLANMLIVPASFITVLAGLLGIVTSWVNVEIAKTFNNASAFVTAIMAEWSRIVSEIPYTHFVIAPWGPWAMAAWYVEVMLISWLIYRIFTRRLGLSWVKN